MLRPVQNGDDEMTDAAQEPTRAPVILINPAAPEIDDLAARFDLHPLIAEDLRAGRQQPKFERIGAHLYLSLWDLNSERPDDAPGSPSELALIFDQHQLLLVQRGPREELRDLNAVLSAPGVVPVTSTISAVHRILDVVVSNFVELGAAIERELDSVEEEVFDSRVREDYRRIYRLRQRIGQIDRAASGLAEAVRSAQAEVQAITEPEPELRPYFIHLEHDAIGIAHLAAAEHAALDAVVSSHQSNVSTRQNRDMRTISACAALLAIPTVIAGIYGMNFKNMPLLGWGLGWLIMIGIMMVIDVSVYLLFRRRGWLGGAPAARSDGDGDGEART
ncbi:magnesium transporter [Microbacterium sp. W4I4]|uniref:magnesium transporter CorA family protein n=1 Tax=Microbacterium sp. W4I4 TaxID=3042295 RepID=UPI0027854838|nr:CorA family divalent cation transporter [Microbacterium sp. W4I4]MDQ0615439.1 magnesium transporter [Microbacterium sp. W4I4]